MKAWDLGNMTALAMAQSLAELFKSMKIRLRSKSTAALANLVKNLIWRAPNYSPNLCLSQILQYVLHIPV